MKYLLGFFLSIMYAAASSQSNSILLKDIDWDKDAPAGNIEIFIPSGESLMAGYFLRANGAQKHPTLLMLHGYPGNERNLDLAQVVRSHGWNVIYFDYRGSWGSQGKFSFKNCVEDVANLVSFCNKYQDSLKVDTSNIVLFGHSMGGWVCLKSLERLPQIKKGFALSTWNIYGDFKKVMNKDELLALAKDATVGGKYFVLNATLEEIFTPVTKEPGYFNLANAAPRLANKQIIMLDEHTGNKALAEDLQKSNRAYFDYEVWQTDHPFTNKRISLMNKVLAFLDK